jgi:type I restriction enzyme S subunit
MKWAEIEIKELGRVVTGKTPPTNERSYFDGEFPFVSPKDLDFDSRFIENTLMTITSKAIDKFKGQVLPKNSVMFTSLSYGFGKMGVTASTSITNQQIHSIIVDKSKHDFSFVYYLLRYYKNRIFAYNAGIVTPIVPKSVFEKIKVLVPKELPTQRKIASILSAYDDLIENNLKRIKLIEEAININYKNLLNSDKKEWTSIKLKAFVNIISGFAFKSSYYNENGTYKIVTIKNVQDGFFVPTVTDKIEEIPDKMNKYLLLEKGDIIMSLTGNVGRVCLVFGENYVLNQRVVKLLPKHKIDNGYLYALLRDKNMLIVLENLSNGTAQQNLSPIKMGELDIEYPPAILRNEFNIIVNPMIDLICKLNQQNLRLREARDKLLPKLINRQIEV